MSSYSTCAELLAGRVKLADSAAPKSSNVAVDQEQNSSWTDVHEIGEPLGVNVNWSSKDPVAFNPVQISTVVPYMEELLSRE